MRYNFDLLPDRRPTDSLKWNRNDRDVLPLWVADMDYPVAEPILQVLRSRIEHGVFGYPDTHACLSPYPELRGVLVERMERLYNWQVLPDEIIFLPGVVVGLNLTCHALATPTGNVLVQTPVYPPFLSTPGNAGMQRQDALLNRQSDGHYEIDWGAFEASVTDQTRVFILCNPHNPVGRVFRKDELVRMAEICLEKGVVICSDEIHCDLLYKGQKHIPIASIDKEIALHSITPMSPTKTYNIAGLQCSFAIIQNQELRKKLENAMGGLVMWVNLIGLNATLTAYRKGQEWLDQVLEYLEGNRDFIIEYVKSQLPGVQMAKPEGTYLTWLDCRNTGIQGNPYEFFLKEAQVALNDGLTFGRGGEGFVRLNLACSREVLAEALERMKAALEKIAS
jgi:cystathionine beta-lyase